ncbi:Glu-tRNA(Gln) amidotransferase subunit GatD [Candidatus Woesearchaeota archaeon]|nr:Glu-tRNA(Gln) amidotransferase subunit GatD [Candidatus Woesearchaeota archaeon]
MRLVIGAKYEFVLVDGIVRKGVLVSKDDDSVFLKLSSGYNEGIFLKNIRSFKKLSDSPRVLSKTCILESKPDILILHTGGTIASRVDYSTGAVTSLVSPEDLLGLYPELKKNHRIGSELISNMPSDDLNFSHYNLIAKKIFDSVKKYPKLKGIILTHGTDTLHYTSAALSFMLPNIPVPVLVVGSQRSSDRPSSDAYSNLLNAVHFISEKSFSGVFVCMHSSLDDPDSFVFRGVNVRKLHSSKRDAFKAVNALPVARVNFESRKIVMFFEPVVSRDKFELFLFNDKIKVGWIRARPGLRPEEFDVYKKFDALVLEGTGLGHFPIGEFDDNTRINKKIFNKLSLLSKCVVLVMVTQTINGRVNLNVYSHGRKLKELGVLGHDFALSPETAYIKVAWLLSNFKKEEIKDLYDKDFVGECVNRLIGGFDD